LALIDTVLKLSNIAILQSVNMINVLYHFDDSFSSS